MTICILKLFNGEELVGRLVGETADSYLLDNPLIVEETTTPEGTSSVLLTSYIPFSEGNQTLSFAKYHVIQKLPVQGEVERYYFNSLEYNRKYVNDEVNRKLKYVNDKMEAILNEKPEESKITTKSKAAKVVSKKYH